MRLLLVVHNSPVNRLAGTELYTFQLAQEFLRRGHSVRILYPEFDQMRPAGEVREHTFEGLSVSAMNLHPFSDMSKRFKNEDAAAAFSQYLSNLDVDIIHFHHLYGFSASALEVCSQTGIPAVLTLHDEWLLCEQIHYLRSDGSFCGKGPETVDKCVHCYSERHPETSSPEQITELFYMFSLRNQYLKNALKWVTTLIVPSRFLRNALKTHGFLHPKTVIAPLGLYPFVPLPKEPGEGTLRFTYLGNINFTKGLDIAIEAFNLAGDGKAQLDIYGAIEEPSYFQQEMANIRQGRVVAYHGPYKPNDLPTILAKTDDRNYPLTFRKLFLYGKRMPSCRCSGYSFECGRNP